MSQQNPPGYPLPDGDLGDDELVCQLVYLPDRPEYWQAFYGAISYMATWRAWERDTDKRGKDAASNWRAALELTTECWRMACLDDIENDLAAILAIMQSPASCCDPTDLTDGLQYTDRVVDGVGNVPQNIIDAGYASGTGDWTGFDDYKCMIAHVTVDQLYARLIEIAPHVNTAGLVVGGLATLTAILAGIFTAGGVVIALGIVAATGAVALLYESLLSGDLLVDLADKVTDEHEALTCAIYFADGDIAALAALNSKIDTQFTAIEAIILKTMNLGPTLKALYAGRYDQQDIADTLEVAGYDLGDFDCACLGQIGEFLIEYGFDGIGWGEWQHNNWVLATNTGRGGGHGIWDVSPASEFWHSSGTMLVEAGLPTTAGKKIWINRVSFWYYASGVDAGDVRLQLEHDAGTETIDFDQELSWTFASATFVPPLESTHPRDPVIKIKEINMGGNVLYIDDISLDYDSDA